MKKVILLVLVLLSFKLLADTIKYDELTIDKNEKFSLTLHNLTNEEVNNLKLFLDGKESKDFDIKKIKNNWLFGVIVDNSGSILLADFFAILDRVGYLLSNLATDDYLVIWKLNNSLTEIYPLSNPNASLKPKISKLIREGRLTRIYDGIIEAKKRLEEISKDEKFANYHPYLLVFSDGDDIGSKAIKDDIMALNNGIPFYFFSYINLNDLELMMPYKKLSKITNGDFIERPSQNDIKRLFIDRLNRYEMKFAINKDEIIKTKKYIVKIVSDDKFIEFDIRKLFDKDGEDINLNKLVITTNDQSADNSNLDRDVENTNLDSDSSNDNRGDGDNHKNNFSIKNGNIKDKKFTFKNWFKLDYKILFLILLLIILIIIVLIVKKLFFSKNGDSDIDSSNRSKKDTNFNKNESTVNGGGITHKSDISKQDNKKRSDDKASEGLTVKDKDDPNKDREKENNHNLTTNEKDKQDNINSTEISNIRNEEQEKLDDEKSDENNNREKETSEGVNNNDVDQKSSGLTNENILNKSVLIRDKEDLHFLNKYDKISLFHNEKASFIDNPEYDGEVIYLNSIFTIKKVTKEYLICNSKNSILPDELIEANGLKLNSKNISYDEKNDEFDITFCPEDDIDLREKFKEREDINTNKKSRIFGNRDAIIEKSLSLKPEFKRKKIESWSNANIVEKKDNILYLLTDFQLAIDTVVEVKDEESTKKYFVNKIVMTSDGKYQNILETI